MSNTQTATLNPHPAAGFTSLLVTVNELAERQDAALMQVHALARLANAALDGEGDGAPADAGHTLAAIAKLAATAIEELDCTMQDIGDYTQRAGAASVTLPLAPLQPLEER